LKSIERRAAPLRRYSALQAKPQYRLRQSVGVGFDLALVHDLECLARDALKRGFKIDLPLGRGRKGEFPKVEFGVDKGHAVNVAASVFAELADQADGGLGATSQETKRDRAIGGQLVFGDEARTVAAQRYRAGLFGKNAARGIRTK
jgi:hypothetical protein